MAKKQVGLSALTAPAPGQVLVAASAFEVEGQRFERGDTLGELVGGRVVVAESARKRGVTRGHVEARLKRKLVVASDTPAAKVDGFGKSGG